MLRSLSRDSPLGVTPHDFRSTAGSGECSVELWIRLDCPGFSTSTLRRRGCRYGSRGRRRRTRRRGRRRRERGCRARCQPLCSAEERPRDRARYRADLRTRFGAHAVHHFGAGRVRVPPLRQRARLRSHQRLRGGGGEVQGREVFSRMQHLQHQSFGDLLVANEPLLPVNPQINGADGQSLPAGASRSGAIVCPVGQAVSWTKPPRSHFFAGSQRGSPLATGRSWRGSSGGEVLDGADG